MEKYYSQKEYIPPKKWIFATAMLLIVVACIVFGVIHYNNIYKYTIKEDAYFCESGVKINVQKNSKIVVNKKNDTILLKSKDTSYALPKLPIYYSQNDSILLVNPMSYYCANQSGRITGSQLECFTELNYSYGNVEIKKGTKKVKEQGNFLFDGENTYVVLRECTLKYKDKEIFLSPFSYVTAAFNCWMFYWDHDTGEYNFISFENQNDNDVVVFFEQDNTTVYCDSDKISKDNDYFMITSAITTLRNTL